MHTYRFTIRPASSFTCPEGWTSIDPLNPSELWNYGTVTYPEPLPRERADHYSLMPVTNPVPHLRWEGRRYHLSDLLGPEGADLAYEYGVGAIERSEFERRLNERLAVCRERRDDRGGAGR